MANHVVFGIAFCVLVCKDIGLVQCAKECKTHADCKGYLFSYVCCRDRYGYTKKRSCTFGSSCLYDYCSTESDCGSSSLCCRSNKCVNKGCSGCTKDSDCYATHHCCKKTFPFKQTMCRANCLNELCNSNDDCAGWGECCRSGKCVNSGCRSRCTSNSECNLDQYCCKKKKLWFWGDGCSKSCVNEICSSDDDCGAPNECCISNKCVSSGCSDCNTAADCSTGHYCCKRKEWYELSECSADCIGKSCGSNDDCGGPGETCDSDSRCANDNSLPSWVIAVIVVSVVVLLIAVGVLVAVFWYRRANAIQASRGDMDLQNTRNQGAAIPNPQPNTWNSGYTSPITQHQTTGFQDQPPPYDYDLAHSTLNPKFYPHQFSNTVQRTQNQGRVDPSQKTPQQGNENHGFCNTPVNVLHPGNPTPSSNATERYNEEHQFHNQLQDPIYHTLDSPDVAHFQGVQ